MQIFILSFFIAVTAIEFFATGDKFGNFLFLPGVAKYVPELMSVGACALVVALGARARFQFVRPAYWVAFGALLLVMVSGMVANSVEAGPAFAGLRTYFRGVPWFFVGAALALTSEDLRKQLRWLLVICLTQLPLAAYQRYRTSSRAYFGFTSVTGDWTYGTMMDAGVLSIFLICGICVASAFLSRGHLSLRSYLALFLLFLIPTTLNETKVTIILLPVALLVSFAAASREGRMLRQSLVALSVFGVAMAIFVPVYNAMMEGREYGLTIGEFLSDQKAVERYLVTDAEVGARTNEDVGRIDSIVVPTRQIMSDPVRFGLGVGIGNASDSALGEQFSGRYSKIYQPFLGSAYSRFILEIGALGVLLVACVFLLIWQDARAVARADDGPIGAFAAAWVAISVIVGMSMLYAKVDVFPSLSYLFWYFSGFIMSARLRLEAEQRTVAAAPRAGTSAARSLRATG